MFQNYSMSQEMNKNQEDINLTSSAADHIVCCKELDIRNILFICEKYYVYIT
jgi:hypothetical protein